MFKTFSQNKFILLLVAILVFSSLIVTGFYFLENSSKTTKLSTNSNQTSSSKANLKVNSSSNSQNYPNSIQNSESKINQNSQEFSNSNNLVSQNSQINIQDQNTAKKITNAEFTKHFSKTDCWVSFDKKIYNVTTYLSIHPGGSSKLARFCSKEIDPVSANHPGGLFGSISIQDILIPFYVGELVQ